MKKLILVLSIGVLFVLSVICGFTLLRAENRGKDKSVLLGDWLESTGQKIRELQDVIGLDPDSKGAFSVWGYLEEPGDWDYYSLIPGEGPIEIHLSNIPLGSDYDLYLYGCDWYEIIYSNYAGNSDELITYYLPTDTYYIGVYCYSGGDDTIAYHLYGTYVTPPKLPDLIVQSLTSSDYGPIVGEEITITLTVKNQGDTSCFTFCTDLYQNLTSPPDVGDMGEWYWWAYWLDPGQTTQFTQVVSNDFAGTWNMYGLVDSYGSPYGYVTEKNECNNVKGPVTIHWYNPTDLVVEDVQLSDPSPFINEYTNITVTIKNQGAPVVGNFQTDVYFNRSNPPAPYTPGDRSFSKNGLSAGESYSCTFYNVPYQPPYLWHMYVFVDSWLNVQEDSENNNIDSVQVLWREHPLADDYGWPVHPSDQQHEISSTFMEFRSSVGDSFGHHFHDGIDIPSAASTPVHSVSAGQTRFTRDGSGIYVDKFLYYHTTNFTIVLDSTWVNGDSLIGSVQTNHVHFNDGYNREEINPLREHGIDPFEDSIDPTFYVDAVTLRQDDTLVGGWNGGADGQVISKDSVYGDVDIVVHVKDEIDSGRRVGLYAITYQVCDQYCYPLTGEILKFQFDQWGSNYNVNYVYADSFYYIVTNQIASNGYWRTTDFYDGIYCLRINAYDIVSFYKKFVLEDTTKLNVQHYFLEDVQLKNGIHGNRNPEIEGHLECRFPQEECGNCIKPNQEMTIQVSAHDDDEGDTLRYEWYCFPGYGYFLPGGSDWIATDDSFVTYVTPSIPYFSYKLWVFVYDNHEGWAELESNFEVYESEYSCLCGDVNDDGIVNTGDALVIVNYLYKGGYPPLDPILRGDANNSCEIDIGDAIWILNWVTRGGPLPACCWFPTEASGK